MSTAIRARLLLENACTVLCCTPTYALHLAEVLKVEGLDPKSHRLRRIVVAGEPGGSQSTVRARLEAAWPGAHVFDHHGMTETGPVTCEIPGRPGRLRILEQSFFAEFIYPDTQTSAVEGETAELVLTPLHRTESPLLRYRTGDLVRWHRAKVEHAPGEFLVLDGGILGRVDDMVIVRGVNVYPSAVDDVVRSIPEIGEYRALVDSNSSLVELGLEIEASPSVAGELERRLHRSLGLRIRVRSVATGSLPRFEMKARRWQRL